MIKRSWIPRLRICVWLSQMTLVAFVGGEVADLWAGETWHTMPGTSCAAFNNNQANMLQRSHRRLYNPLTNPSSVWVICPIQVVQEDVKSTPEPVYGNLSIYFDPSVMASVTCIVREYYDTMITITDELTNSDIAIAQSPFTFPVPPSTPYSYNGNSFARFDFTNDDSPYYGVYSYWTATCKLLPGTGVNSFSVCQR